MKKSKTSSFVLNLKLNTSFSDDKALGNRFFVAFLMTNRLVRHARARLSGMRSDPEYRSVMKQHLQLNGKDDPDSKKARAKLGQQLSDIRQRHGLSEYQFHAWIAAQQHRYHKYIDSHVAQKIATAVWQSVDAVLFRKGKTVHFKQLDHVLSVEGKNNVSGIRFSGGRLHWLGLDIQPQVDHKDLYAMEALKRRVKYCRIVRRAVGSRYHYYLQLILEGKPPKKRDFLPGGRVGIDPGTASEAVVSDQGCILTELAPKPKVEKQVRRIQRKMDRSRRANNPGNYNPDGTIKARNQRKPWKNSKAYKRNQMCLKALHRRNQAYSIQQENILANKILCEHGSDIFTEKMNYKALQARAKEDKLTPAGKHRSKKRFGKSLSAHAPSRFLAILERKLSYIGKILNYVDTWKFKASQYDHVVGDYIPVVLSSRSKTVGGHKVQRDLYSAFLLWNTLDPETVDRDRCFETFRVFLMMHDACIRKLLAATDQPMLSSFGLKDFQGAM